MYVSSRLWGQLSRRATAALPTTSEQACYQVYHYGGVYKIRLMFISESKWLLYSRPEWPRGGWDFRARHGLFWPYHTHSVEV